MKRRSLQKLVVVLLSLNVAIVALLLATVLRSGEIMPAAWAQLPPMQPLPASRDVIVAPGQLSTNQWGCYVLDTRANTLCIYQYSPADRMLRLQAARGITQDLRLASFNTMPQRPRLRTWSRKNDSFWVHNRQRPRPCPVTRSNRRSKHGSVDGTWTRSLCRIRVVRVVSVSS